LVIDIHDHMLEVPDFEDMSSGGVTAKFCHLSIDEYIFDSPEYWSHKDPLVRFLRSMEHIYSVSERSNGCIVIVKKASDIEKAKKEGHIGLLLGNEGGGFLKGSIGLLQLLYRFGLRFIQLTWAKTNELATAQSEYDSRKGLTKTGRRVITEMCRLGMIIDLSHLSRRSIEDCFELSDRPMIFSHGNVSINSNSACLDKGQMRSLAQNRGIIGMHFCSHIIEPGYTNRYIQASIDELLDSIETAIEFGGEDCIALGPDFMPMHPFYLKSTNQEWLSHVKGVENIGKMSNITDAMVRRGYSDELIGKILGGNAIRVIREAIG